VHATASLIFTIGEHVMLVDMALIGGALYLQPGNTGDRLIHNQDRPKILVEVPNETFRNQWIDRVIRRLAKAFVLLAKDLGMGQTWAPFGAARHSHAAMRCADRAKGVTVVFAGVPDVEVAGGRRGPPRSGPNSGNPARRVQIPGRRREREACC
jgi:hypothetical protein